jgi:hypothetical protein
VPQTHGHRHGLPSKGQHHRNRTGTIDIGSIAQLPGIISAPTFHAALRRYGACMFVMDIHSIGKRVAL